jgi:hypothetical protein
MVSLQTKRNAQALCKYDVNWECKYNDKRCADVMVYKQQNEVSSTHLAAHREWCKKTQRVMCSNIKKKDMEILVA